MRKWLLLYGFAGEKIQVGRRGERMGILFLSICSPRPPRHCPRPTPPRRFPRSPPPRNLMDRSTASRSLSFQICATALILLPRPCLPSANFAKQSTARLCSRRGREKVSERGIEWGALGSEGSRGGVTWSGRGEGKQCTHKVKAREHVSTLPRMPRTLPTVGIVSRPAHFSLLS